MGDAVVWYLEEGKKEKWVLEVQRSSIQAKGKGGRQKRWRSGI